MKTRRLRLPQTPSPAVEKLRDYLRAIYAAPMPWHTESKGNKTVVEKIPQPKAREEV